VAEQGMKAENQPESLSHPNKFVISSHFRKANYKTS